MSSSHSRSSSEILSYQYIDVLPVFFKAFKSNFDFDDVKDSVKDIFTKEEYQSITSENDEEHQLMRLFSVLCSRESLAIQFLERIKNDYWFLCEAIRKERDSPQKHTLNYIDIVHMWRSNHPKHTDFNVLRINWHIRLRDYLRKLKPCHSVVLLGDLGMGKKWLTLDVCYDYDVLKAMNFQIYWLDVNDCNSPEQDLNRLQTLRLILGGGGSPSHSPTFSSSPNSSCNPVHQECANPKYNESISNRKLELQQYLRKKLSMPEHRNCLLILKDVQNLKTVQTFNLGFKLLVITRNKKVSESLSSKMSTHLSIDSGLTKAEFFTLFEKYLNQTRDTFPKQALDIYEYGKGHPYLLSMIAQNMRQRRSDWIEWSRNLKNFEINDNKFTKVVEISLNVLSMEQLELYAVLGIFPHSVPIPVKLLAALWHKPLYDADEIVQRFHKFSLVSKVRCNANAQQNLYDNEVDGKFCCCLLPFIYSSHLRASKKMKSLINGQQLHQKVIEYYKLKQVFSQRTELELCDSRQDWYFYTFIGYHLQAAGGHETLFPLIYWDFGFLEQKIRAVGLSNTIGDLKLYEQEITGNDHRQQDRLAELREFLPKVEEKLTVSADTSLLQYALMASGAVYEMATTQIRQFAQRVWFTERGNFHKRRQIVHLKNQAKSLRFLDQDLCLIILANNNMLLLDISLENNSEPVLLQNDGPRNSGAITEARLFLNNNFILTLDTTGALKVWSIADDQRHSIVSRRCSSSRQKVHAFHLPAVQRNQAGKRYKQRIQENALGQHGHVVAFYIEQSPASRGNDTTLHVAFSDGEISVFKWNPQRDEFCIERIPILKTGAKDIRFLCKLLDTYYMLIGKSGDIAFWNLRDSSKSYVPFEWKVTNIGPLSYELYDLLHATRVIIIYADRVMSLLFKKRDFNQQPDAEVMKIYENRLDALKSTITCAKLSPDQCYLVVGTKRGIIVYDMESKSEVLRSNVSEAIACLDIYPLDDKIYKYVIICGSEHRRCLNIFAVRKNGEQGSITWAHNVTSMGNEVSCGPQLEPDVWLLGQKLYDVYYKTDGSTQLVAVDSKNRVHQVNTKEKKIWFLDMIHETTHPITAITTGNDLTFVGYKTGQIFNMSKQAFETSPMKAPIVYLQIYDDTHLVASTDKETNIRYVKSNNSTVAKMSNYGIDTKKSFKIFDEYLLLINELGFLTLIDLKSDNYEYKTYAGLPKPYTEKLCTCDYQNDHLILATPALITIWKFKYDKTSATSLPVNELLCAKSFTPNGSNSSNSHDNNGNTNLRIQAPHISAIALSKDAALIAIGLTNGDIEIYKMHDKDINYFYSLLSHRTRINDMKFSLGNEVLASCAEQLCFWSVPYLLNNPLQTHSTKRRSSRFSSQRSSDIEEVDARVVISCSSNGGCNGNGNNNFLNVPNGGGGGADGDGDDQHLNAAMRNLQLEEAARAATAKAWCDKRGPADKPELLACIKFDGNKAEKLFANPNFTHFNTIDDEGVYYHLELLNAAALAANIAGNESLALEASILNDSTDTAGASDGDTIDVFDYTVPTTYRISNDCTDDLSVGEDDVYA